MTVERKLAARVEFLKFFDHRMQLVHELGSSFGSVGEMVHTNKIKRCAGKTQVLLQLAHW